MAFPLVSFAAGERLTAAKLNQALSIERVVQAPADQSVTSSTTLVNSTYIVLPVDANALYVMDMLMLISGATAGDITYDWVAPSGSFMRKSYFSYPFGETATTGLMDRVAQDNFTGDSATMGTGTMTGIRPSGYISTSGTSGTLQFRFAQRTSSASATTLRAGTWMRLTKIA